MLDVIEKILILPPVECIEESQTIPTLVYIYNTFSRIYKLISLTAINDEAPYCIRVSGSGCSEKFQSLERLIHRHCDTNNRVPW